MKSRNKHEKEIMLFLPKMEISCPGRMTICLICAMQNMVNVKITWYKEFLQGTDTPGSPFSSKQEVSKKVSLTWQE